VSQGGYGKIFYSRNFKRTLSVAAIRSRGAFTPVRLSRLLGLRLNDPGRDPGLSRTTELRYIPRLDFLSQKIGANQLGHISELLNFGLMLF